MNKVIGYVLTLVGLGILALGLKPIQTLLGGFTLPFSNVINMSIAGILIIAGIFVIRQASASSQSPEVPIYEGKAIVGYRKVK